MQGFQRLLAPDGAHHVQRDDVAGALPDRTQMRVAHQARIGPFFYVAAAAAHFHGVAGGASRVAAGAEFDQGGEDAHAAARLLVALIRAGEFDRSQHEHAARLFRRQHQFEQLAAHQRQVDQLAPEGLAVARKMQRVGERAAHHAGRAHAVGEPRHIDHVGHLREAAAEFAHEVGGRAFHADFAARHVARAQLVLQPDDAVLVCAAVGQGARQQEQPQAAGSGHAAFGARQHQREVRIGVGAEPLVAVELPGVALRPGDGGHRAYVGSCALFGDEHGALGQGIHVGRGQPRQVARDQFRCAEFAQRARERIGHAQGATQAEFGLHEQIGQRVFRQRRQRLRPAEHAGSMRHRGQAEFTVGQAFHFHVGRMLLQPFSVEAAPVAVMQHRRILVRCARKLIERIAREYAQAL